MSELKNRDCIPCQGGVPPLKDDEKKELLKQLNPQWKLQEGQKRLERKIALKDFAEPMKIAQEVAVLADEVWHHPELIIRFKELVIRIWTHKIDDLVESDFIFAAKADEILKRYQL